ncbi:TIGR03084 family protein [Nocardioides immobilis]|uniref:TIGR03084 family protein n=1 Tax=Nocardioides immobilis TaxID=2049295 RepID=A0A417Y7T0_9ACTN|nr:TIGR03084 family metal-binding protein [Nocardioides immobilis]RHW28514.1 TIGR03084 family protein [Nocardioides immobilis]
MMTTVNDLLSDLVAETAVLDDFLADLAVDDWETQTPAAGWAVRDQVGHLAFFDEAAVLAATDPDRFRADAARLIALGPGFPDIVAERFRTTPVTELSAWYRAARLELITTFVSLDGKARMPWYGPDMSITTCLTARLMETWAHAQDVLDTFGVERTPTIRLRHVAHLGVQTRGFSFQLRGRTVPLEPVHVVLTAPDGDVWQWGEPSAANRVEGDALDFCLVVTQRRHLDDTQLVAHGPVATEWLTIAQAFAGAPGPGRAPLTRSRRVS